MSWLDLVILFILALAAYKGYKRGFVREVLFLAGLIISCFVAWYIKDGTSQYLNEKGFTGKWVAYVSFILVFITIYLLFILAGNAVKKIINFSFLGMFDNMLGLLTGIFLWSFLLGLFFLFINYTVPDDFHNSLTKTKIISYLIKISSYTGNFILDFFPAESSFYKNLKEFFEHKTFEIPGTPGKVIV